MPRASCLLVGLALSAGRVLGQTGAGTPGLTYNAGGLDWSTSRFDGGEGSIRAANNSLCATGRQQSPMNIVYNYTRYDDKLRPVNATYEQPRSLNVSMSDYTLGVVWDDGMRTDGITQGNAFLPLRNFHLHTPSEHTFNGQNFPLEMHLVHQNPTTGRIIIVAVLFHIHPKEQDNTFIAKFLRRVPPTAGASTRVNNTGIFLDILVDLLGSDIIPGRMMGNYFTYNGSLTTPPCTEGVTYYVLRKTQAVSTRQVVNVTSLLAGVMGGRGRAGNARPTQPANGRIVYTTKPPTRKFDIQSASSFEKLLEGEVNIDSRSAHRLAQGVAALIVLLMLFMCFFCISVAFIFVQRTELHKLKHPHNPMTAAGAVVASIGPNGEPVPQPRKQSSGLGGMIQLGGKRHNDQEMLL